MPWQVIADEDVTAAYGARVLSFTAGEIIEGEVARYLAAAGAPRLGPRHLALLDRPNPLRPRPARQR